MRAHLHATRGCIVARKGLTPLNPKEKESEVFQMAIYHCSISNVSRRGGSSSTATLSYIQGLTVKDERREKTFYGFGRPERIDTVGTVLPSYAPKEFQDPRVLFNSIELFETASNARTAKKIEVALPRETQPEQNVALVERYIQSQFTNKGYCASYAIHTDQANNNPHAHILVANRRIDEQSKTWEQTKQKMEYVLDEQGDRVPLIDPVTGQQKTDKRNRKQWKRVSVNQNPLDKREFLQELREHWAIECNRYLEKEHQIDHRSHQERGIERIPTLHEGYVARQMEQDGKKSERCQINRVRQETNRLRHELSNMVQEFAHKIHTLIQDLKQQWERIKDKEQALEQRQQERQEQLQALNKRNEPFLDLDDDYPVFRPKKAVETNTAHSTMKTIEKTEQNRFREWEHLRPSMELLKQKARHTPRKQEKDQVEQLIEKFENKRNQTMVLTDWETFHFEIKQGEYLNVERYGYEIQSHRIELLDENWFAWGDREYHKDQLRGVFRGCEVTKSKHKIEKTIERDQGFEIE